MEPITEERVRELIEGARRIGAEIVEHGDKATPVLLLYAGNETPNKVIDVSPLMENNAGKDLLGVIINKLAGIPDIAAVVFVVEAWYLMLDKATALEAQRDVEEIKREGLAERDDKREGLIVSLYSGSSMWTQINEITRESAPTVGRGEVRKMSGPGAIGTSEGRFVPTHTLH